MTSGLPVARVLNQLLPKREVLLKFGCGLLLGLAGSASMAFAQESYNYRQASYGRGRHDCGCYQPNCQNCQPSPYSADGMSDGSGADGSGMDGVDGAAAAPYAGDDLFTSNDTVATSPTSIAPNMIGDMKLGGISYSTGGTFVTVPIAAGDRRFKIADNNNPLPQDRILFNYHHFENGVTGFDDVYDVNRYTFGIEKTFWDGMASFEIRAPFASGLKSTQVDGFDSQGVEFGNITAVLKVLLFQTDTTIVSAGLAATLPTAKDAVLLDTTGVQRARIDNEAVFLQPFIGASVMNYNGVFFTFFGQMDFDVTGDGVTDDTGVTPATGQVYNQSLLLLDAAFGKWVYRDPYSPGYITGIAPVVELHYTSTMTDADTVGNFTNPYNRVDGLNLLGGIHFLFGQRTMLTVTAGAPLRTDDPGDKFYDAEIGVRFNRYF